MKKAKRFCRRGRVPFEVQVRSLRRECRELLGRIDLMAGEIQALQAAPRGKRISREVVTEMHAFYVGCGHSLAATGRRFGRDRRSVRDLFISRSLHVPKSVVIAERLANGRVAPYRPLSAPELDALVQGSTKLRVPPPLKLEWRHWPLEQRAAFLGRLRAKLRRVKDAPTMPYSSNVVSFDYGTSAAWEIVARLNQGRDSRAAAVKIDLCSQGVIYDGRLWFWTPRYGYQGGPWVKGSGRPVLHHVIWEEFHDKPVPPGHVLYFLDGNKNNLLPENLGLKSRGQLATENKDAGRAARRRTNNFFRFTHAAAQVATVLCP